MKNWKNYLCCFYKYYHEYRLRRVRKIYEECFTEDKEEFIPANQYE